MAGFGAQTELTYQTLRFLAPMQCSHILTGAMLPGRVFWLPMDGMTEPQEAPPHFWHHTNAPTGATAHLMQGRMAFCL